MSKEDATSDGVAHLRETFRRLRGDGLVPGANYHLEFEESGRRKADAILRELSRYELSPQETAFVSIGGSTGAEAIRILERSNIRRAILLEADDAAVEIARNAAKTLPFGNALEIICGDATQKLPRVVAKLQDWRTNSGLSTVIISAQAVLHELPLRSPGFNLDHFLGELFGEWPTCLFFSRETCPPKNWPDYVRLRAKDFTSEDLETIAIHIQKYLSLAGSVQRHGTRFVRMPKAVAIEVLTKIFYAPDFPREMQEKVTTFSVDELVDTVRRHLGLSSVTQRELTSSSFEQAYQRLEVQAVDDQDRSLNLPLCFLQIVGERLPRATREANRPGQSTAGASAEPRAAEEPSSAAIASTRFFPARAEGEFLYVSPEIRASINMVLSHPGYPQFMSIAGRISRNPVWNFIDGQEMERLRDEYNPSGPTPPQIMHLDMFLIRKDDGYAGAQLYTYFSPDWGTDLISFRLRTRETPAADRFL